MSARLGIFALVILGVAACSSPDWVGDGPATEQIRPDARGNGGDCVEAEGAGAAATIEMDKPGIDVDIAGLAACCQNEGAAHCVPEDKISDSAKEMVSTCPTGGVCIPDTIIQGKPPATCDSGYGPGVCVSVCVKAISAKAAMLQQATCASNELCAPCLTPLDHKPTGACELGKPQPQSAPTKPCTPKATASAPLPAATPSGGSPATPSPTPPAPSPDAGSSTGTGATGGPASCCGGKGTCVPEAAVSADRRESLEQKECAETKLCAPTENVDPSFAPKSCIGQAFASSYEGVCLSNCLVFNVVEEAVSSRGTCDADHRCMPCKTPWGRDTGAPGCK